MVKLNWFLLSVILGSFLVGCSHPISQSSVPQRSLASVPSVSSMGKSKFGSELDHSIKLMDRDHNNFNELSSKVNKILCQSE